jgi:hypothetical protein
MPTYRNIYSGEVQEAIGHRSLRFKHDTAWEMISPEPPEADPLPEAAQAKLESRRPAKKKGR